MDGLAIGGKLLRQQPGLDGFQSRKIGFCDAVGGDEDAQGRVFLCTVRALLELVLFPVGLPLLDLRGRLGLLFLDPVLGVCLGLVDFLSLRIELGLGLSDLGLDRCARLLA